jgi:MSHA biogenesis protein MshP
MRPDPKLPHRASGFGLVAAMFLIIVVALVIAAMARLSTAQHGTSSLAIQQARAYQAARAGLEWGITQAFNARVCAAGSPTLAGSKLSDFAVVVNCTSSGYINELGTAITIFRFTATAQNGAPGARPDYAYRQLTAVVER